MWKRRKWSFFRCWCTAQCGHNGAGPGFSVAWHCAGWRLGLPVTVATFASSPAALAVLAVRSTPGANRQARPGIDRYEPALVLARRTFPACRSPCRCLTGPSTASALARLRERSTSSGATRRETAGWRSSLHWVIANTNSVRSLVPQHQQLDVFGSRRAAEQDKPAAEPNEDEIHQAKGHGRSSSPTADAGASPQLRAYAAYWHPRAAAIYAVATARGCRHPHAIRILARTLWGSRTQPLVLTWASMRPARIR